MPRACTAALGRVDRVVRDLFGPHFSGGLLAAQLVYVAGFGLGLALVETPPTWMKKFKVSFCDLILH